MLRVRGVAMWRALDVASSIAASLARLGSGARVGALGPLTNAGVGLASLLRPGAGAFHRPAREPALPLELWSFEASPGCRLVREALCAFELPYRLHNVARGSPKRASFARRSGGLALPRLYDPNSGCERCGAAEIARYLRERYALPGGRVAAARV